MHEIFFVQTCFGVTRIAEAVRFYRKPAPEQVPYSRVQRHRNHEVINLTSEDIRTQMKELGCVKTTLRIQPSKLADDGRRIAVHLKLVIDIDNQHHRLALVVAIVACHDMLDGQSHGPHSVKSGKLKYEDCSFTM